MKNLSLNKNFKLTKLVELQKELRAFVSAKQNTGHGKKFLKN